MSVLLAFALATVTAAPLPGPLPHAETACDALSSGGLAHHEALRIERDFGKPDFELVVDAWTSDASPDALADVRLWWVKTSAADRRSPLSSRSKKYVDIETTEHAKDAWSLKLRGDRKEFRFAIELDGAGRAHAFTDIIGDDGRQIRHCRATGGTLQARRLLGIPVGIDALVVDCIDDRGRAQRGRAIVRKLGR